MSKRSLTDERNGMGREGENCVPRQSSGADYGNRFYPTITTE